MLQHPGSRGRSRMNIAIYLDRARLFRWHAVLAGQLATAGHKVDVRFRDNAEPLPTSFTVLLDLDRVLGHEESERFSTRLDPVAFARFTQGAPEPAALVIDLSTAARRWDDEGRTLRPLYDGSPKDFALLHAVLDRRAPMLAIADSEGHKCWPVGLPALQTPWLIALSIDEVTSRLIEALLRVVSQIASGTEPADLKTQREEPHVADSSVLISANTFFVHKMLRKMLRFNDAMMGDNPKWHVAWRMVDEGEPLRPGALDLKSYRLLDDDGHRYYADPFPIVRDGLTHIFVEEFPEATGKGVISQFTISAQGDVSTPRMVLDEPHHLSYPQVFEHGGEIWMLPEAHASGGLNLYRAETFPDRWSAATRIIDQPLHDATFFEHDGLLWIAASRTALQSSSWDSLVLFWARDIAGPWSEHTGNPVLIDARCARPAGPPWREGDMLIRPAQDCTAGYGSRLTLRRTQALSADTFAETTLGSLAFSEAGHILGPHTIGRAGRVEVIDLYARPSALRAGYR